MAMLNNQMVNRGFIHGDLFLIKGGFMAHGEFSSHVS